MSLEDKDWDVQFQTTVGYFTDFLDALDAFRDEGQLIATDDAVFSDVVDPSNVGLAKSKVTGKAFDSFEHKSEDQTVVGVNFERTKDFLKNTGTSSTVTVTYPVMEGSQNYMHLDILDEDLQFNVPLVDKDAVPEAPQKEPISCETRVTIDGSSFKKVIRHCKKVESEQNSSVELETYGNVFKVSSVDKVKGSVEKEFNAGGPNSSETLPELETSIAMGYLDDIKNIVGSSESVTIHIDTDYPLRLDVDIDDGGDAKIIYVIAPRLDEQA